MPPTFWVEIEMEGGMGCYRGLTGGEIERLWIACMCHDIVFFWKFEG
jgi:hypothetical protein